MAEPRFDATSLCARDALGALGFSQIGDMVITNQEEMLHLNKGDSALRR